MRVRATTTTTTVLLCRHAWLPINNDAKPSAQQIRSWRLILPTDPLQVILYASWKTLLS